MAQRPTSDQVGNDKDWITINPNKTAPASTKDEWQTINPKQAATPQAPVPSPLKVAGQELTKMAKGAGKLGTALVAAPYEAYMYPKAGTEHLQTLGNVAKGLVMDPIHQLTRPDVPMGNRVGYAVLSVLGVNPDETQDYLSKGQYGQALATLVPAVVNTLPIEYIGRMSKMLGTGERTSNLVSAMGKGATLPKPEGTLTHLLPDLTEEAGKIGAPAKGTNPFDWLGEVAQSRLTDLDKQFNNAFNTTPGPVTLPKPEGWLQTPTRQAPTTFAQTSIMPKRVENAVSALKKTGSYPAAKEFNKALDDFIADYDLSAPKTYGELNEMRRELYKDHKMSPGDRLKVRSNGTEAARRAAEDALRDIIYDDLGSATGQPGHWAELKSKEHDLISLLDQTSSRIGDYQVLSADWKSAPLYKKVRMSLFGHPAGATGMTLHPDVAALWGGPAGVLRSKIKKGLTKQPILNAGKRAAAETILGRVPGQGEEEEK